MMGRILLIINKTTGEVKEFDCETLSEYYMALEIAAMLDKETYELSAQDVETGMEIPIELD